MSSFTSSSRARGAQPPYANRNLHPDATNKPKPPSAKLPGQLEIENELKNRDVAIGGPVLPWKTREALFLGATGCASWEEASQKCTPDSVATYVEQAISLFTAAKQKHAPAWRPDDIPTSQASVQPSTSLQGSSAQQQSPATSFTEAQVQPSGPFQQAKGWTTSTPQLTMNAVSASTDASHPTLDQFLGGLDELVAQHDAPQIQAYLILDPSQMNDMYTTLRDEVQSAYPEGEEDLAATCDEALSRSTEGSQDVPWAAFSNFVCQYLVYLRDVQPDPMISTHLLTELNKYVAPRGANDERILKVCRRCNTAMSHASLGVLILPTMITYAEYLANLATQVSQDPQVRGRRINGESLPERAANTIRSAFITCLSDKSVQTASGKPEGRRAGVYKLVNICLKLMAQCKLESGEEQLFSNIQQQAPPLHIYPAAQRVTYLYYLGRYYFTWNHFHVANLVLSEAYRQCARAFVHHRRRILVPLIAANIIMGRFPTPQLLQRPEAQGLAEVFVPICQSIQRGNVAQFHTLVSVQDHAPYGLWLFNQKIVSQLRARCPILVWRCLWRRVFLINGDLKEPPSASTLKLQDALACLHFLERHDPERHLHEVCKDLRGFETPTESLSSIGVIQSRTASMVQQGFLKGFIHQASGRFAIQGAGRGRSPVEAGFPNVWQVFGEKVSSNEVKGWKREAVGHAA